MPVTTTLFAARAQRTFLATCMAAAAFLLTSASYAQIAQAPGAGGSVPGNGPQTPAPVNPESMSCNDLKAELKTAGELSLLSGPRGGWGDTFYGPAVPRCQFWQMPQFTYVRTRDGLCGVGYICIDKLSFD
jgi:hypothetical protein